MPNAVKRTVASLACLALAACSSTPARASEVLYHGFTRLDPLDRDVIENAWVVVDGERIVEVGHGNLPGREFAQRVDMSGLFGLPGFVDAHGHITAGPHAVDVVDGAPLVTMESRDDVTRFNARSALAFGVTTVRNPGADPEASAAYDQRIASGEWIGPDAVHAGAVIQPPPFGGSAFTYPRSEAEWQAEAAREASLGMRYLKLYQGLTEDELATGIRIAHAHGLEAMAHLDGVSWQVAADLGIDALLHALPTSADLLEPGAREAYLAERGLDSKFMFQWFEHVDYDGPIMQRLFETLAERQIEVDLTLMVNILTYSRDPMGEVFPVEERRYYHPDAVAASQAFMGMAHAGWGDADYARAHAAMERVLEFARRLHEAGVPLLIGTDGAGGGPIYADELQLHADAGIPVWEVLRLATSGGAEGLGLGDVTGRIAAGYEADLVFLRANPLADLAATSAVELVVTNGRAHDPQLLFPADAPIPSDN